MEGRGKVWRDNIRPEQRSRHAVRVPVGRARPHQPDTTTRARGTRPSARPRPPATSQRCFLAAYAASRRDAARRPQRLRPPHAQGRALRASTPPVQATSAPRRGVVASADARSESTDAIKRCAGKYCTQAPSGCERRHAARQRGRWRGQADAAGRAGVAGAAARYRPSEGSACACVGGRRRAKRGADRWGGAAAAAR